MYYYIKALTHNRIETLNNLKTVIPTEVEWQAHKQGAVDTINKLIEMDRSLSITEHTGLGNLLTDLSNMPYEKKGDN